MLNDARGRTVAKTYLPVCLGGLCCGFGEQVQIPLAAHALPTVASRAAAQSSQGAQSSQTDEAAADLQAVARVFVALFCRRLHGRVLIRSQHGGHVQRSQLSAMV